MNTLLLVVDSLRADSVDSDGSLTPFLKDFGAKTINFRKAYATECWTLPSHCSMFTGLLPSEHGAHFRSMRYLGAKSTLAECLADAGYYTEVVTRNFVFDGTILGLLRGFKRNTCLLSRQSPLSPAALYLTLTKPGTRRRIRQTGFFHPLQRANREFVRRFARSLLPADVLSLDYILDRMIDLRRSGEPYFLFANLYDVHAPYPPTLHSLMRPFWSVRGTIENVVVASALASLSCHVYLRPGFRLRERSRQALLARYHKAAELMDAKLHDFWYRAHESGALDNTLLILTSDHGEAFGEHDLYLHDASVYNTHLHVPLWIYHPGRSPEMIDDIVSTADLFGLIRGAGMDGLGETMLDPGYRERHPVALAQHFHYPHLSDADAKYKQNIAAVIAGRHKIILRRQGVHYYDLASDPREMRPETVTIEEFEGICARDGTPRTAIRSGIERVRAGLSSN